MLPQDSSPKQTPTTLMTTNEEYLQRPVCSLHSVLAVKACFSLEATLVISNSVKPQEGEDAAGSTA